MVFVWLFPFFSSGYLWLVLSIYLLALWMLNFFPFLLFLLTNPLWSHNAYPEMLWFNALSVGIYMFFDFFLSVVLINSLLQVSMWFSFMCYAFSLVLFLSAISTQNKFSLISTNSNLYVFAFINASISYSLSSICCNCTLTFHLFPHALYCLMFL